MNTIRLTTILATVIMSIGTLAANDKNYRIVSPDGKIEVDIDVSYEISYTLRHSGTLLLDRSTVKLELMDGNSFDASQPVRSVSKRTVNDCHETIIYKKNRVKDHFNEIRLKFKTFSLVFRAYDDGMAYRFISEIRHPVEIKSETAVFNFANDWKMWAAYVCQHTETLESQFYNSFENTYSYTHISEWNKDRLAFLPLMIDGPSGKKIVITESDVMNYPGMYLYNKDSDRSLEAVFAHYPDHVTQGGHNDLQMEVQRRKPYIAENIVNESLPWRIIAVSENDVQMADNDMVYRLAAHSDPDLDWSWVRPGKVAWDWWNAWNLYGVDFKTGINNDTYKYYIDFASSNGIEYVILDEGWSVNGAADLFQVVPEIDLRMLVEYATERNVGLILWAGYWAFDRDMENVCRYYSEMGIKGFKIDFMDRDDQYMTAFHKRAAETAAKYRMMVDFHGTYKPTGLHRTFPNVVNYEGVHGLEQMKWSPETVDQVTYDVTVPYIRMMAGPMDYTQGAMRNASRGNYRPINEEPMSQGTRCRQLAEYIVFDSPLNMLCDSPSNYMKEKECLEFIASVPTIWDETFGICGEVGKYIVLARRSGDIWYVGGMTDWTGRTIDTALDFLPEGNYCIELYKDGVNAERSAQDYRMETFQYAPGDRFLVEMAPGGGFAAKITKKIKP